MGYIKVLDSGYLYLRINEHVFAQWPSFEEPRAEHCFPPDQLHRIKDALSDIRARLKVEGESDG